MRAVIDNIWVEGTPEEIAIFFNKWVEEAEAPDSDRKEPEEEPIVNLLKPMFTDFKKGGC